MTQEKTERDLLEEISEKLDKIIAVLAIQGKNTYSQIEILHGLGWKWDDVGKFVGMKGDAAKKRYSRKK